MTCNKQTTNGYYGAISSWLPFAPSAGSWLVRSNYGLLANSSSAAGLRNSKPDRKITKMPSRRS
jgi:hypothetical protein